MTDLAQASTHYAIVEDEPPELLGRNLHTAGHLWAATTVFFFVDFVFAFFYLRSLNNHDLWHPKGITPSLGLGTAIVACVLLSVALTWLGLRERRRAPIGGPYSNEFDDGRLGAWRRYGLTALVVGLVAVILQCIQYATMDFGPTGGGYASVFVGWTGMFVLFVIGAMFWLETLLATSFRYRRRKSIEPGEGSSDAHRKGSDIRDPLVLVLPSLEALTFFWTVLGVVALVSYILLYAVK